MRRPCASLWKRTLVLVVAALLLITIPFTLAADSTSEASSSALSLQSCVRADYVAVYGSCLENATRLRTWKREAAALCSEDETAQPPPTYVPCASCPAGMQHRDSDQDSVWDCQGCPVGDFLDTTETPAVCATCPPGTSATPVLAFRDGFDDWSGGLLSLPGLTAWQTICPNGEFTSCTTRNGTGFEFVSFERVGESRDGGSSNRSNAVVGLRPSRVDPSTRYTSSFFNYSFAARSAGWVEVTFVVQRVAEAFATAGLHELPRAAATLTVDGVEYDVLDHATASTTTAGVYVVVAPFVPSREVAGASPAEEPHGLRWNVSEQGSIEPFLAVTLLSLVVSGDSAGGVTTCEACPPGYACPTGATQPLPCAPGTYQPATHAQYCLSCASDTVAPGYGFHACLPCTYGGSAYEKHTTCQHNCLYVYEDVVYDFTAMAGVVLNASMGQSSGDASLPMSVAEADAAGLDRVYVSLCGAMPVAATAEDAAASGNGRGDLCVAGLTGHNSSRTAYVCERTNATTGNHFGGVLDMEVVDGAARLVTSMGSLVTATDVRTSATAYAEPTWRAVIQLECDADSATSDSGAPSASAVRVGGVVDGVLTLSWRSAYACPRCTEASYERVESLCSAAHTYTITYARAASAKGACAGGFVPPSAVNAFCTPCAEKFYTVEWQGCDAVTGVESGRHVLKPKYEGCRPSDMWQPVNQTRSCPAGTEGHSAARRVSAVVGGFAMLLACGLVVTMMLPDRGQHDYERALDDDGTELHPFQQQADSVDGLEAHYNLVGTPNSERGLPNRAESHFSHAAGQVISSLSNAFQRLRATAGGPGRDSPPLNDVARGNDFSTLPTAEALFSDTESLPRPSHTSRGGRSQVMFALDDDDDEDLLPPRSPY